MSDSNNFEDNTNDAHSYRDLSDQDFLSFGLNDYAYVKKISVDNNQAFAIHAADGTPLTIMEDFDSALLMARQNNLEPVTVH